MSEINFSGFFEALARQRLEACMSAPIPPAPMKPCPLSRTGYATRERTFEEITGIVCQCGRRNQPNATYCGDCGRRFLFDEFSNRWSD